MRKRLPPHIPFSALLTGLLASPGLGGVPAAGPREAAVQSVSPAFPAAMPPAVEEEMRRLARGGPLSAHGMTMLQGRLAWQMQARLALRAAIARAKLHDEEMGES